MKTQRPVDPGPPTPPPPPGGGGGKSFDWAEITPIAICMFFLAILSLYHISYEGYLGLSVKAWGFVWAVSENGLAITMTILLSILTVGIPKIFFRWVLVPYFILRLVYHITCYSGLYMWSEAIWANVWSIVLIIFILLALVYCIYLIKRK